MAVRTKGRAKFAFRGRSFVWYVADDHYVRIVSADKRYCVSYCVLGPRNVVKVSGREFAGLSVDGERPVYLLPPEFGTMPLGERVHRILIWSFDARRPLERTEPTSCGW